MTVTIDTKKFEDYLDQVQKYAIRLNQDEAILDELLKYIEEQQLEWTEDPSYQEFFKGEYAFFIQEYDQALKHYLQARAIPLFQFFCYRASAFVSKAIGNHEKAISFSRKALKFFPNDYLLLTLLKELLTSDSHRESAQEIHLRLQALENGEPPSSLLSNPHDLGIPMGEKTVHELNHIFESHSESSEELFLKEEEKPFNSFAIPVGDVIATSKEDSVPKMEETVKIENSLNHHIQAFLDMQNQAQRDYKASFHQRAPIDDHCLFLLSGNVSSPFPFLCEEHTYTTGFYVRWNQKGIVVNPGSQFLQDFHAQGLHIRDIDYVIVTHDQPLCYAGIKQIYDLAYQVNRQDAEPKVIHYYLNQTTYQELSLILKPHFKQERNSLHSLELFVDSSDIEKVELSQDIHLNYFPISEGKNPRSYALGIRLDLRLAETSQDKISCGYLSGAWSPAFANFLKNCDLIIAGFGHTSSGDYDKIAYNENSLGYFGSYALLNATQPRLFILTEFAGKEGDIRLEIAKKMRAESQHQSVILPADANLAIRLKMHQVQCSISKKWVSPQEIRVIKSSPILSRLTYASDSYYL